MLLIRNKINDSAMVIKFSRDTGLERQYQKKRAKISLKDRLY